MIRTALANRKKLLCPSCNMAVHFQAALDDLGTCPSCGQWLISRGKWHRTLERLDPEPNDVRDDIRDDIADWELSIIDKIG